MGVPALYIYGSDDPVPVTVRVHERIVQTGDISGLETVAMRDVQTYLRFEVAELADPKRAATISIAEGEAYLLGESSPSHGTTVDVTAVRLTTAEAAGLPVP